VGKTSMAKKSCITRFNTNTLYFYDRADWIDVADNIEEWFNTPAEERERVGELGRQYTHLEEVSFTAEHMCDRFMKDMDKAFKMWKPRKRYSITKVGG